MQKKSIKDLSSFELKNKKVLVRVDFNVPMKAGGITDDSRIKAALPTIHYLLECQAKVVLISHLGRPSGKPVDSLSLKPVATYLEQLLGQSVLYCDDCVGDRIKRDIEESLDRIIVLENVRFHSEEMDNDSVFSQSLSELADFFVQDAFGSVHRAHASTEGVAHFLPAYAGLLVEKELSFLGEALDVPDRPFVAIVGGAKVSSKITVLQQLLTRVDVLFIGGGMAFTFLKAQGYSIGKSLCEEDKCDLARELLEHAKALGKQIVLPKDIIVADRCDNECSIDTVSSEDIPEDKMGLDVGPETLMELKRILISAKTVLWNGPLGVFEVDQFSKGTCDVATLLSTLNAVTIIGGGDSVAAINKVGVGEDMTHISTGGGACLEFLEGKELPGIRVIEDKS
ncbi:phosphoglycerate kinase [Candidatus Marinamargulisbacteria bacterium SCGC AG-343-D04]|nr:phosphoglycerate kinase [Candidatus Marinamargulisbacteria bacterium SCGC AG-343-D04]